MPIYEYQCQPNGHRFEVRHGIHESPVGECPQCGGPVRRVIHPVGIVFKGSGFYATDSRSGKSSTSAGSTAESKSESAPAAAESTSPKTETKSDSSAD